MFRIDVKKGSALRPAGENWSGEATRGHGFAVEEARVDVTIGDEDANANASGAPRKERPVWMVESTVMSSSDPVVRTQSPSNFLKSRAQSPVLTFGSVVCPSAG